MGGVMNSSAQRSKGYTMQEWMDGMEGGTCTTQQKIDDLR